MRQTDASVGRPTSGAMGGMTGIIGGKGQAMAAVDYISNVTSATDFTVLMQ